MNEKNHPVWGVYDLYRTARLNYKYYSAKLNRTELVVFWMDLILLVTAPSSAIAGLWFWDNPTGEVLWKYLGSIAAIVAIIKPLLNITKKIKRYEELRSGYSSLEHDLQEIKELVFLKKRYDNKLQNDYKRALKRKGRLAKKEIDSTENKKLKRRCEKEVLEELPVDSFYIPKE